MIQKKIKKTKDKALEARKEYEKKLYDIAWSRIRSSTIPDFVKLAMLMANSLSMLTERIDVMIRAEMRAMGLSCKSSNADGDIIKGLKNYSEKANAAMCWFGRDLQHFIDDSTFGSYGADSFDKATISMLWFIIIKHNEWVDEIKNCIDILIDRLNETIEEAEKELQTPTKTMKRITNINQLKPGNKIFTVNRDGSLEILEFREIHPNNDNYSLFLNENQDGMHKFFNKTLEDREYYLYDDSDECWKFIYEREIAEHKRLIGSIEERMTKFMSKPASLDSIAPYWDEERNGVVIPLIGKVLHAKCLGEADWGGAKKLAEKAGGELFSKKEGYILAYYKDEINELLEAHGGDKLEGWNWCSSEYSELYAWYVNFVDGYVSNNLKYGTNVVRAVSAF